MNRQILFLSSLLFLSNIFAQKYYGSSAFTEIGFSARSLSLGNTMFSDADPAVEMYFNPAVVTNRNRNSIHMNYRSNNPYFGKYLTFGIYHPIKHSSRGVGLNIISYNVSDIEGYDKKANFLGKFEFKEYFGSFTFTSTIHNIAWGIKLTGIYNAINEYDKSEFIPGIEVGTTYDLEMLKIPGMGGWDIIFFPKIGFMGKRYFHPDNYKDKYFVPTKLLLGLNLFNIKATFDDIVPILKSSGTWTSTTIFFTGMYYDLSKKGDYPARSSLGIAIGSEIANQYKISFNLGRANVTKDNYNGISKDELNALQFDGNYFFLFNSFGFSLDIYRFSISYAQTYHPYFNHTDYFSVSLYW